MIFCVPLGVLILVGLLDVSSASDTILLDRVFGFKFCSQLSGSVFDINSVIDYKRVQPHLSKFSSRSLKAAARMEKPQSLSKTKKIFAEALDLLAQSLSKKVLLENLDLIPEYDFSDAKVKVQPPDQESARRFACFSLAEGVYEFAPFVAESRKQRILQFVDSRKYFGKQLSFAPLDLKVAQSESNLREYRKRYFEPSKNENHVHASATGKLAFILMVHKNIANIKEILKDISESESAVLIHVDGNYPGLKQELQEWLKTEYALGHYNRNLVKVMAKSFKGAWGHSSLVFIQLEAMFVLLTMNDKWEYVVNMIGYDILLVDHETLYNQLCPYGEANWLTMHTWLFGAKQSTTLSAAKSVNAGNLPHAFNRKSPTCDLYLNSQWMTLHRSTAQKIRQSPSAATYLAHKEFGDIPDEAFMSNLLAYSPFVDRDTGLIHRFAIVKKYLRYLTLEHQHATLIDEEEKLKLDESVKNTGVVIARKVDYSKQSGLVAWIRSMKNTEWSKKRPMKCKDCLENDEISSTNADNSVGGLDKAMILDNCCIVS